MKRVIGIGIVSFWVVMVGLLIHRQRPASPPVPLPQEPLTVAATTTPRTEWMGIYQKGRKVGSLQRQLVPAEHGYQWQERWRMHLQLLGTSQMLHTEIRAHTDQRYALRDFSVSIQSGGVDFRVTGAVVGPAQTSQHVQDETAVYEFRGQMTTGGETSPFTFPIHEPLYLPATTHLALRHGSLQPGEERTFRIFNPLSMRPGTITVTTLGPATLSLHGQTVITTKVAGRFAGTTVHIWLDQDGNVVKEEAPLGLVLLRESQEEAVRDGRRENPPFDLVASTAIRVPQPLPDPGALSQLRVKLAGVPDDMPFTFPPRQQQQDNIVIVRREEVTRLTTYTLPQTHPEFADDLMATPFIQSAHPLLMAQAQDILGTERDALHATQQLLNWTYETLGKIPTVGMPTALDALRSKQGDCNEHAVLFTALARASGLPARVAAGVVYLDGAFYYHAWSEVWLGQWIAVDPVLGQFPADATHVKLVAGGPEHHFDLLRVIDRLGIEVVAYH